MKKSSMEEQEYSQFIEFGNIFDRNTREYLVKYIKDKVHAQDLSPTLLSPDTPELAYLRDALDKVFDNQQLLQVSRKTPLLAKEITKDILKWMKQALQNNDIENPYQEEQKELERWHVRPAFMWVRHWYKLTNYLRDTYPPEELNSKFYEKKFEELTQPINAYELERNPQSTQYDQALARLEIVIDDLLERWQALLTAKRLKFELENLDKQREEFCTLLYAKIDEFVKLLSIITPFQDEVGRFWDMSRGLWQEAGFDILNKYAQLLEKEESIQELADILGKMREAETEIEEEIYEQVISKKTWIEDNSKKSEIGGIYESDNLNQIIPSEVSLLTYPETESVFLKKLADKRLLTFREQGRTLVNSDKIQHFTQQKQKRKEKGPFIICIDTSGSMEGLPEQIAKVICFAIIKMAAKENRKCFLISFSIGIQTINLHDLSNSMDAIVKFLSMSFHGGTDVTPAMSTAIDMLSTNDYKEADVLMVSDFVMYEIREEIIKRIHAEQEKGTKFHSLTISKQANPEIVQQFDNNWIYNPEERGIVRHLISDLRSIA